MSNTVKLNPPLLEGRIPAQQKNKIEGNATYLNIPFQMNRSVGMADFDKLCLLIKSASTNKELGYLECGKDFIYFKNNTYYANFEVKDLSEDLQVGQYYKAQLAYSNNGTVGFYSSSTTFKFTVINLIEITGLSSNGANAHTYSYTGRVDLSGDKTEKLYSYKFEIFNSTGAIVAESGEQLHNSSLDTSTEEQSDTWTTRHGLQVDQAYTIKYTVKTINGLELSSPEYLIQTMQLVDSELFKYYDFKTINNAESACIELSIEPKEDIKNHKRISGLFNLLRASSEDNFSNWYKLSNFILSSWSSTDSKFICKDYGVSQGVSYKYGIQAYNNEGVHSSIEESEIIYVDFEDMFLSDGERQLRIRFNPKVSSIKNTILESKMDTLGSKYPFFFRNGNVKYKEFPISGLISTLMDENNEFIRGIKSVKKIRESTPAQDNFNEELIGKTNDLSAENFRKEREFKLEVLEWLTNGKPKLFRSPGEGSYIVRLMNTSLSPNDTLGRMIHTFSCTAYEVAECNFDNLRKYGMLMDEYIETRDLEIAQINLGTKESWSGLNAVMAMIESNPGLNVYYKLQGDTEERNLIIGNTGQYVFDNNVLAETPLVEIRHIGLEEPWKSATMIYGYYTDPSQNNFSQIESIEYYNSIERWIGDGADQISSREDIRIEIPAIYYINVQEKNINTTITRKNEKFYEGSKEYTPLDTEILQIDGEFWNGATREKINNLDYRFIINDGNPIDMNGQVGVVETSGRIILTNIRNVETLTLGNALYADVVCQQLIKTYTCEKDEPVKAVKNAWLAKQSDKALYKNYIDILTAELQRIEEGANINAI